MKPETRFRKSKVDPFLKELENSFFLSIQQLALVGSPDKIGCINGYFVALELKDYEQTPKPLQAFFLDQFAKAGGVALAARPENWMRISNLLWGLSQGILTPKQISPWRDYLCSP